MEEENKEAEKVFFSNPQIIKHYSFLQEIGVFSLIDGLLRSIRNYETIIQKGLDIFNRTSISEIMDATVQLISYHFLPSYIAFLWKPIQTRSDITIRSYQNYKPVDLGLRVDNITLFESFFQKFPKLTSFATLAKKLKNDAGLAPFKAIKPEIVIPILGPFGLYGIILIGSKTEEGEYTNEEKEILQQFMAFMSQAIKNYLHYEHSLRDVKTGLYNHGFFMTRLNEEVNQTRRHSYSSSVIVIDVDKFKNFNDTYGHLAGDQVLENLAQVIRQSVRENDIPSRFGGEEFTVMLSHAGDAAALLVAERLRTNVANMRVPWEVTLPQVTISLGIFTFDKESNLDSTNILRHADEALYASKSMGRNCSTVWKPGLLDSTPDDNTPNAVLRN